MRMSFNARLSWQTTIILATTMLVVFAYTWNRAQAVVEELSGQIVNQTSVLVSDRIEELYEKTENGSTVLAGLASPSSRFQAMSLDSDSFQLLASQMVELVRVSPEFSAMNITLDSTGEYVQVVRSASDSISVEIGTLQSGRKVRKTFSRFGGRLIPSGEETDWITDLRNEEHYRRVSETKEQIWTETGVIQKGGLRETPGITCATPILGEDGRFLGVAGVDLTLSGLSRYLSTIKVGTTGHAFLAEMRANESPRIVAHYDPNRLLISEGGRDRLATAQELGDAVAAQLLLAIQSSSDSNDGFGEKKTLTVDDRDYFIGYSLIGGEGRPDWVIGIFVPTDNFTENISTDRNVLVMFAIIALMAGIYVSLLLARKIAVPVREIVEETERIRALDFSARPLPSSQIVELDQLGDAMEQLKSNLRSFEKLVPTQYARYLIASGKEAKLGGERKHITIYFADLVGFTKLSEQMPPEELMSVLADYLDVLSGKVDQYEGTVDKFNGDDVMAFWGAPNDVENPALSACLAAIRSQQALSELHIKMKEEGRPVLRASFGISTGDVIVGNVGSRDRMNYTVIGDAANLASRLQGLNKYYETEMLIGGTTREEAGDGIVTRLVDYVSVAGRDKPVAVYELIGLRDEADSETLRFVALHNDAMAKYRAREFEFAVSGFRSLLDILPGDTPAKMLLKRCERFVDEPPDEDWDGSHRLEFK